MLKVSLREYKPDCAQVLLVSGCAGLFSGSRDVSHPSYLKAIQPPIEDIFIGTQRQSLPAAEPLLSGERVCSAARDEYIAAVMGNGTRSEVVEAACQWQVGFLESQIKEAWIPLFRRVLEGVDPAGLKPSAYELSITFRVLAAMVREFRRDDRALVQIVDELYNSGVLIETDESDDSDYAPYERSTANQIVFTALGLISE
jgi:hypothetical protein